MSIVIPAHNEAAVLAANLRELTNGTKPGEFDVIVVANACSDRTAEIARDQGARVVETATPGKANALHLGDELCQVFPRVYADADVGLSAASVRELVAAVGRPGVLAASPVPRWNLTGTSWVARRVHTVHDRLVAPSRVLAGTGVYTLTEEGHKRVFPLPDGLLSDDGWVHASFSGGERVSVPGASSTVAPARTVRAHLRRRVRVRLGNRQLEALGRPVTASRLSMADLRRLVAERQVGRVDAACYLAVLVLDKVMTRLRRNGTPDWGTDASTRQEHAAS